MTSLLQTAGGLARRTVQDITRPLLLKQMLWVGVYGALMVVILLGNIDYLKTHYPDPARPDDLILDTIPETREFIAVGEILSAMQFSLVIFLLWRRGFVEAPHLLFLLITMYLLRAYAIVLTPLAQIQPPELNYDESHFIARAFYHGMFFSGHTASAFVQAFFFKRHRLRPVLFLLASGQAAALLISHSHYTIDIFGGLFVAYFVTHFDFSRLIPPALRTVPWMPWYDPGKQA